MGKCKLCCEQSPLISSRLGVCSSCIRAKPDKALKIANLVHEESRIAFELPPKPPKVKNGLSCGMCANNCKIGVGGKGFCGLVYNIEGRIVRMGGTSEKGVLQWYYDPLPTNCVAWWFCPGCTGRGYPKYAHKKTAETGYSNLAVFYGACSYDCLYCQNWHYRNLASELKPCVSAESLAAKADQHVSCICFFGGDPSVQMPHALKTSEFAVERARVEKRIMRICWETNGYWKTEFALKAAELSLHSGGNIKFDLKAWNSNLNMAMCGVSNEHTFKSFKLLGERFWDKRHELPILTASTLLVPGYIDAQEVDRIACFIAEVNESIPYTLLAFYPNYVMNDLPTTSREQANQCLNAARKHLKKVRVGNVHLLC